MGGAQAAKMVKVKKRIFSKISYREQNSREGVVLPTPVRGLGQSLRKWSELRHPEHTLALKPGGGGVSTVEAAEVGVGGKKDSSRAEVSGNAFYKIRKLVVL